LSSAPQDDIRRAACCAGVVNIVEIIDIGPFGAAESPAKSETVAAIHRVVALTLATDPEAASKFAREANQT
ncbi:MAG: hypothetical protein CFH39_02499, partial [Alphaproteobacteria bacterium MarineAlpha10_Bin2]